MRVCLMIEGQEGVTWDGWQALAQAAEAAGLDGLFRSDHYQAIVRDKGSIALDAWATLAALAAVTKRIRLGTLVSPVTFRPPAILAKNVATVDHISGGRVELGIGAGWYESEHRAYSIEFGTWRSRLDELDRQLAVIVSQWADEALQPRPVQKPHPPIIVGGRAGPRTVAAAVRHADEYNLLGASPDEIRLRVDRLREAADAAGRAPLRISMMASCVVGADQAEVQVRVRRRGEPPLLAGTVNEIAELLHPYAAAGVERVMLQHLEHEDIGMVPLLGEVARLLDATGGGGDDH